MSFSEWARKMDDRLEATLPSNVSNWRLVFFIALSVELASVTAFAISGQETFFMLSVLQILPVVNWGSRWRREVRKRSL